jgi:hypothetical protein
MGGPFLQDSSLINWTLLCHPSKPMTSWLDACPTTSAKQVCVVPRKCRVSIPNVNPGPPWGQMSPQCGWVGCLNLLLALASSQLVMVDRVPKLQMSPHSEPDAHVFSVCPSAQSSLINCTLLCHPSKPMTSWLDACPTTSAKQVCVVPKSAGLVSQMWALPPP